MNLITNAAEAIGDREGAIRIATGSIRCGRENPNGTDAQVQLPDGEYVYMDFTDTGCGMDQKTTEQVFDPFFSTKFTGRGLGLAAAQGIVRGHNGSIRVQSEEGVGTTFRVLLPASGKPVQSIQKSPQPQAPWKGRGTILLVDDDETVRRVAGRMLERAGFQVLTANDGHQAVDLFQSHMPEITCVLLDLTMPKMDGEETLYELRRLGQAVPIILSSGYNAQETIKRFTGKGLAGFMQKPYEERALLAKLREILEPLPAPSSPAHPN
jgi:two-component system, cell cycle sensor histidine kinase and response regulator CckA